MSVKVARDRFIVSSVTGFYQYLTSNVSGFQELGEKLSRIAEIAQAFRQTERLEELGSILSNFPIKEYRLIGQYYLGWSAYRKGGNVQETFEQTVEQSKTYKATALIDLANIDFDKGDFVSALKNCIEAMKRADNLSTVLKAARSVAILKSLEGSHNHALKDLERIYPLIKYASPIVHYQYLNSYAVELGEAGRIEEASNICKVVLASPYAFAYPEWRETDKDIALRGYKSRSSVSVIQSFPRNVFYLPQPQPSTGTPSKSGPARLFNLNKWKEDKMVKEPNGDETEDKDVDKMSEQDMVLKLIEMLTTGKGDEKKIRQLLKTAFKIFSEK